MKEQSLKGEIAVVTGSDFGIGQATAIAFAREGADVAMLVVDGGLMQFMGQGA